MTRRSPQQSRSTAANPAARRGYGELSEGMRYILLGGVAVLAVAVLGVVVYQVYINLFPSNPLVLRVGDREVHYDYFAARLGRLVEEQGGLVPGQNPLPLGQVQLDAIIEEEILLQSLDDAGITVSDTEVQEEIETRIGAEEATDFEAYRRGLIEELEDFGLSEEEYRRLVTAQLARNKLEEKFQAEIGDVAPQARFHRLNLTSQEDADAARERLLAGDEFADVALEFDPTAVEPESGPDWVTIGAQGEDVSAALEQLEPDEVSEPISTGAGFVVVQMIEKQTRPIDESDRTALASARFIEYIQAREEELGVVDELSDEELADAFAEAL
jgi:parvulin-like peptidyl-prolyl isomerase